MKKITLETMEADESLKSLAVALSRYIAEDPEFLLELEKHRPLGPKKESWKSLYDSLHDDSLRAIFKKRLEEDVNNYDWTPIKSIYIGWGKYGWIVDRNIGSIGFWDTLPSSQEEADELIMNKVNNTYLNSLEDDIKKKTHNPAMFDEACTCFRNPCYIACASLLTSLIDGVLTATPSNYKNNNRKTGCNAEERLKEKLFEKDFFGLPGYFNLEIENYNAFITTIFARANGFTAEPLNFNRNYLQHGMSNRKVSRGDCIKLFIAYRKTIDIAEFDAVNA